MLLARTMGMTVKQLLAVMDSRELTEHMIDYKLEPWGEQRADLRAGIIAATINNVNASKKEYIKKPSDFMPYYDHEADDDENGNQLILEAFKNYGRK